MYKTLMLALALLVPAAWLQAQDTMSKSSPTTIEGCLSNHNGQYWLTDSTGKVYQLSSNAQKLSSHVGHTVQITGMPGVKTTDTTVQGSESTAKEIPVFKVKSVQHVADSCKSQ